LTQHVTLRDCPACHRAAEVGLYVIADGGHTWRGGPPAAFPGMGKVSDEINATDVMCRFFERHTLPETVDREDAP
jgi:polyhydroxybutyrate depolymerase